MKKIKNIAIIAFESKKTDLIEWSYFNKHLLIPHHIYALGFAVNILEGTLNKNVSAFKTGLQDEYKKLYERINDNKIDAVIIFGDADEILLSKDLSSIFKVATDRNIIVAANKSTADFILHSTLINKEYIVANNEKKIVENQNEVRRNAPFQWQKPVKFSLN